MRDAVTPASNRGALRAADLLRPGNPWAAECGELWDGVFVVREPSGGWSGVVGARVLAPLMQYVAARRLGWVIGADQGYFVARRPDRVLSPDVSYVSKARLPAVPRRRFIDMAPDFVVEVRSSWDRLSATLAKCGIWAAHGVPVVWAIDPDPRQVVVFRGIEPPVEAGPGGVVNAAPVLPDFRLAVDDLFEELE